MTRLVTHDTSDRRCSCGELLTCLAATPAPLDDDGWQERGNPGDDATPAPLDVLVAARAVVDWAEMAEGGNVAAEDAMFDRIDRLRAALNAQEADHE